MGRTVSPLERGVLGGLAVFRAAAWAWMAIVLYVSRSELGHPAAAWSLCGLALAVTIAAAAASRWRPDLLLRGPAVVGEVAVAAAILLADGWVYGGPHRQSLGSAWPVASVLSAGVAGGPIGGIAAGLVCALGRYAGTYLDHRGSPGLLSLLTTAVTYALAGGAAGLVTRRLRQAQDQIAAARAREEVARTLHDGVLQTLAVVQRRSTDAELAALARTQERELREYLFGADRAPGDLLTELRHIATTASGRHGIDVELTVVDDPGTVPTPVVAALVGAVGEALTNAAKHGHADRAVVFVDPGDDDLTVSVNDDGSGFDADQVVEGVGLSRSIRGRIDEVGGTVVVASVRGGGTEVRLVVPA